MRNRYFYFIISLIFLGGIFNQTFGGNKPACKLDTLLPSTPRVEWSPDGQKYLVNKIDTAGVWQLYMGNKGDTNLTCISMPGPSIFQWTPWSKKNKVMAKWHPSGKWIVCAVQKDILSPSAWAVYVFSYPLFLQIYIYNGLETDIWATDPQGKNWYQMVNTDYGFVGVVFTPDGSKGVWSNADTASCSITTNKFGCWKLMRSDFVDTGKAGPVFVNTKNITPAGTRWIEPGNLSPVDGKSLLISSDLGLTNAYGQDQFIMDILDSTKVPVNLTNSPKIWDEHGVFSPDGKKVFFMSSYPYRADTTSYQLPGLKTEFMLMDAAAAGTDSVYYPGVQQLTHFQVPGYPEYVANSTAAVGLFTQDGTEIYCNQLLPNAVLTDWVIKFNGPCGNDSLATIINEKEINRNIVIYPNPANSEINLSINNVQPGNFEIQIFDLLGQSVYRNFISYSGGGIDIPLDIHSLKPGVFVISLVNEQRIQRAKFLKK